MLSVKSLWIASLLTVLSNSITSAETIKCADPATVSSGQAAFDAYCIRCHKASEVATRYFSASAPAEMDNRETELAGFLDHHSA